jgi:hypothetical protein
MIVMATVFLTRPYNSKNHIVRAMAALTKERLTCSVRQQQVWFLTGVTL